MISVITPSFNQGKYIERTIQSVLTQHIPGLEYFVVDGGSQDETVSILERYSSQLRFVSEKDKGQADAVNKGLRLTSHDIIGWLNSDDVYFPNTIKTVLDFFAQHPDVDVVFGKANHIDQYDQFIEEYPTEEWNIERLKKTCILSQPAVFFRRRVVEKFGDLNINLNFCLDYEFWLRLALRGAKFSYLPHVFAGSRLYPETKTVSSPRRAQREAIQMLKGHLGYVPEEWLIRDAVVFVKDKTQLKMPEWRYKFSVAVMSIVMGFRWNGFLRGLVSCVRLPKAILNRG